MHDNFLRNNYFVMFILIILPASVKTREKNGNIKNKKKKYIP